MPTTTEATRPTRRQQAIVYIRLLALLATGVLAYLYLVAPAFSGLQGRPSSFLVWNPGPGTMQVRTTNLLFFNAGTTVPPGGTANFSAYIGTRRLVKFRMETDGRSTILRVPTTPAHTALATPVPLWCVAADREKLKQVAVQPLLAPWLEQLAAGKPGETERLACIKKFQAELVRCCPIAEIRDFADDWCYDLSWISSRNAHEPPVASQSRLPLLVMPDPQAWLHKPLPLADSQIAIRADRIPRLMVTLAMPWGKNFPGLGKPPAPGSQLTVMVICEGDLIYTEARLTSGGRELCPPLQGKSIANYASQSSHRVGYPCSE